MRAKLLKKLVFRDKKNYRNKNNKVIKNLFLISKKSIVVGNVKKDCEKYELF